MGVILIYLFKFLGSLHDILHYITSNNFTLTMCSNLDEDHAKCPGNLVTQNPQPSKCLHEPMPPYFIRIYHLCDSFKCEYGKLKSFWVP